jgi:hypothetical protein
MTSFSYFVAIAAKRPRKYKAEHAIATIPELAKGVPALVDTLHCIFTVFTFSPPQRVITYHSCATSRMSRMSFCRACAYAWKSCVCGVWCVVCGGQWAK